MYDRVYLYLTNKCNKNCDYCYQKDHNINYNKKIDYNKIIDFLKTTSPKQTVLFGGEPTLKSDLIKKLIKEFSETEYIITTNGILLDNIIDIVKDNVFVQFSVNSVEDIKFYNNDHIFYHMTISSENVKNVVSIFQAIKFNNKRIWFSFDRTLSEDISSEVEKLLKYNILNGSTMRKSKYSQIVGKECFGLYGKQKVLNCITGKKYKCTHLMYNGEKNNFLLDCIKECDNQFCEICPCTNITKNKKYLCKVYKMIEKHIKKTPH